jgi:hypothetical protein
LWSRLAVYTGIGLLSVLATSVVFVIVPLLALDLAGSARQWRSRPALVRGLLPGVIALGLALAHLHWFVMRQSTQLGATYWRTQFVPRGSVGQAWHFASTQLAGWIPEVVTGPLRQSPAIGWLLGLALLAGTAIAVVVERRLLVLPVTLCGALALQYVAAARWQWPFGFVRVNLFLVPLVYLLAAAGIARSLALLGRFARAQLGGAGRAAEGAEGPEAAVGGEGGGGVKGWRWWRVTLAADLVAVPLVLALVVAVVGWGVVPDGLKQVRVTRGVTTAEGYGDGMRALVQAARELQVPGSLAVVGGAMGTKGWAYYMWDYTGWAPDLRDQPPIGADRTLLMDVPDQPAVAAFLAAHRDARQILVLYMRGTGPQISGAVDEPLLQAGYREVPERDAAYTGHLSAWVKATSSAPIRRSPGTKATVAETARR